MRLDRETYVESLDLSAGLDVQSTDCPVENTNNHEGKEESYQDQLDML